MKKLSILLLLLLLVGCQKTESINLSSTKIYDANIKLYDILNNKVMTKYSTDKDQTERLIELIENLKLKEVEIFDGFDDEILYAVEFDPYTEGSFIFSENMLVTDDGKVYRYSDKKLIKTMKDYLSSNTYDGVIVGYTNQRYLSLVNDKWESEYLFESNMVEETTLDIIMDIEIDRDKLLVNMTNKDSVTIDTGRAYQLGVLIEDRWYNLDYAGKNNLVMGFNDIGYTIKPNATLELEHTFKHMLPLPKGKYRIIKEITYGNKKYSISKEFNIGS